ncbi:AAA family ATPase [Mariprofundus erugo]|uniref:bifunctional aminoglycoside phosphotransferase/ATP-binding protein n=1 Tax=Mariprofundus erugo TaxID=2528639 RepID=UPI001EE993CF|nr:bifunctional aminoglycoside phosphotransferase/ATP-binding protein [Mariprofundus erugo]
MSDLPLLPEHLQPFLQPAFYPHPCATVRMIQTHISWVFLSGDYAYKVKKPVNPGFLDFSTLEKRHHFCQQELTLNRRLSPAIYLAVLPVCRDGDHYHLNGPGQVVDYCLKMRRFRQSDLLDRRLRSGCVNPYWMDQLAQQIAAFHQSQAAVPAIGMDHTALLCRHIHANIDIADGHIPPVLDPDTIARLSACADAALQQRMPQLLDRQQQGHVRHCHGDLHLKNITIIDDQAVVFDCIEFNDEFATIDTMNDLAFLIMDCDAHQRSDLGMRLLSRYLEQTADYPALSLLPLYLFYRAGVRGKVACLLADALSGAEQHASLIEASHYFTLASRYCQADTPHLFAIGGFSGSGKSHLALLGCGRERAIIIRSDATRKRIAANYPELDLYGMDMTRHTYQRMYDAAHTALMAGFSVILDAAFLQPEERLQVRALAETCQIPCTFFWLNIDPELLRRRICQRQLAGNDISDADLSVLQRQLATCSPPREPWLHHLSSSDHWPDTQP